MRGAAALLALLLPFAAQAGEGWRGLYATKAPPVAAPAQAPVAAARRTGHMTTASEAAGPRDTGPDELANVCIREILAAQTRHAIPDNLLLAIGLQEAGTRHKGRLTVWPFAVNAAGEGRLFDTEAEAQAFVRARQAAGVRSIDVGCMQINLRWHPRAFADLDAGFDPGVNVDYSARFLKGLRAELGSWRAAAGAYHSRAPKFRDKYLSRLEGNIASANARHADLLARVGHAPTTAPAPPPARASRPSGPPLRGVAWGARIAGGGRGTLYSGTPVRSYLLARASE